MLFQPGTVLVDPLKAAYPFLELPRRRGFLCSGCYGDNGASGDGERPVLNRHLTAEVADFPAQVFEIRFGCLLVAQWYLQCNARIASQCQVTVSRDLGRDLANVCRMHAVCRKPHSGFPMDEPRVRS